MNIKQEIGSEGLPYNCIDSNPSSPITRSPLKHLLIFASVG